MFELISSNIHDVTSGKRSNFMYNKHHEKEENLDLPIAFPGSLQIEIKTELAWYLWTWRINCSVLWNCLLRRAIKTKETHFVKRRRKYRAAFLLCPSAESACRQRDPRRLVRIVEIERDGDTHEKGDGHVGSRGRSTASKHTFARLVAHDRRETRGASDEGQREKGREGERAG